VIVVDLKSSAVFGTVAAHTIMARETLNAGNQKSRFRIGVAGCNQNITRMLPIISVQQRHRLFVIKPIANAITTISRIEVNDTRMRLGQYLLSDKF
jgi:hypothetical protein